MSSIFHGRLLRTQHPPAHVRGEPAIVQTMIPLTVAGSPSRVMVPSLRRPFSLCSTLSCVKPSLNLSAKSKHLRKGRKSRSFSCRAEFAQDAPLAFAIGACMLNSLVFPVPAVRDDDDDSLIDTGDARFAVMGIISFIPYFNWLSWVFAWLDTGKTRYVVYSIVYLAPYFRSNLSLSTEESWLPIASIVFCIIHIQLEASIRNGDFQGFQLFNEAGKNLTSVTQKNVGHSKDRRVSQKGHKNLPSAAEHKRKVIEQGEAHRNSLSDPQQSKADQDEEERTKH